MLHRLIDHLLPSHMTRDEAKLLFEEVRANHARLAGCARHEFDAIAHPRHRFIHNYRCKSCGGTIDANNHHWYARGVVDGAFGNARPANP